MNFKVMCSVPDINVFIDDRDKDNIIINVSTQNSLPIGECKVGDVVKIGNRKYLIVNLSGDRSLLITTEPVTRMRFGVDHNFMHSDIRVFCEERFCEELKKSVPKIFPFATDLQADDGTYFTNSNDEPYYTYFNCVSIPSTSFYRKYRSVLSSIDLSGAATVNAVTATGKCDSICQICSDGILSWSLTSNQLRVFCVISPDTSTYVQLVSRD